MKEITVVLVDGPMIHTHGEEMLDSSEGTLILYGDSGSHLTFNWNHVLYYAVSPMAEEENTP